MTTLSSLQRLPVDCLRNILIYLGLRDLFCANSSCKGIYIILSQDGFVEHYFDVHFSPHPLESLDPLIRQQISQLSHIAWLRKIGQKLRSRTTSSLCKRALDVSSVDRAAEGPANVLQNSPCYLIKQRKSSYPFLLVQHYCGCTSSRPCYWSSAPSESADQYEFMTFQSVPSVVLGFFLVPYQAFFHPGEPIYGPKEVAIQFLHPRDPTEYRDVTRLPNHYRAVHSDGPEFLGIATSSTTSNSTNHIKKPYPPPTDRVYYTSPFYAVENVWDLQFFFLPRPALSVGPIRLVLRGMHSQQPGAALHADSDDYYMCISRFDLVGIPIGPSTSSTGDSEGQTEVNLRGKLPQQLQLHS
jgi:hypothetical protein